MYNQFDNKYNSFDRFDPMPLNTYKPYDHPAIGTGYTNYRNDPLNNPLTPPIQQAQQMVYSHMAPALRPPGMM